MIPHPFEVVVHGNGNTTITLPRRSRWWLAREWARSHRGTIGLVIGVVWGVGSTVATLVVVRQAHRRADQAEAAALQAEDRAARAAVRVDAVERALQGQADRVDRLHAARDREIAEIRQAIRETDSNLFQHTIDSVHDAVREAMRKGRWR